MIMRVKRGKVAAGKLQPGQFHQITHAENCRCFNDIAVIIDFKLCGQATLKLGRHAMGKLQADNRCKPPFL